MDGEDDDSKHIEEQYNCNKNNSGNAAGDLNEVRAVRITMTGRKPAKKYCPRFGVAEVIVRILSFSAFSALPDQGIYMKEKEHNQREYL